MMSGSDLSQKRKKGSADLLVENTGVGTGAYGKVIAGGEGEKSEFNWARSLLPVLDKSW